MKEYDQYMLLELQRKVESKRAFEEMIASSNKLDSARIVSISEMTKILSNAYESNPLSDRRLLLTL